MADKKASSSTAVRNARKRKTGKPIEDVTEPRLKGPSLAETHPKLAEQWCYERNCGWTPSHFTYGSGVIAWWQCTKGEDHIWKATLNDRTVRGREAECPFCSKILVSKTNSLKSLFPDVAQQFDAEANGITSDQIVATSAASVWWICDVAEDHRWQTRVIERTGNHHTGCPFCANQALSITNSLATRAPHLAAEFMSKKNGTTPDKVIAGTEAKFWWKCGENSKHIWEASAISRYFAGTGCPQCNRGKPTDLREWPNVLQMFDTKRNPATDLHSLGRAKYWWRCPVAKDHVWFGTFNRRPDNFCPFCRNKKACKSNSLARTHKKLAKEFHPTKNKLSPEQVVATSHKRVWWQCPEAADHVWSTTVYQRAFDKTGCPYCLGRKASSSNNLSSYPRLAREFAADLNGTTPRKVVAASYNRYWWRCRKGSDHVWQASAQDRSENGAGCPFCRVRRLSETNSLAEVEPELAKQWHKTKNADLTPSDVTCRTAKIVWWQCEVHHEHAWRASISNRAVLRSGCPYCCNRKACSTNSLASLQPQLAREWHPIKNGSLTASDIVSQSARRVWWKCALGHVWLARVSDRVFKLSGCPKCYLNSRKKKVNFASTRSR